MRSMVFTAQRTLSLLEQWEYTGVIQNDKLGVQVQARSTDLLWNGRRERMITCLEAD